jgi:NADPH:quinone reductase-like Zn-dependent oxidoreductase
VRAIRVHAHGGPEVLTLEDVDDPTPGRGEALVRHRAIGINFIDTYHRTGLYPLPLPHGLGMEASGVVEAIGEGVTEVAVGDRVAYAQGRIRVCIAVFWGGAGRTRSWERAEVRRRPRRFPVARRRVAARGGGGADLRDDDGSTITGDTPTNQWHRLASSATRSTQG